VKDMPFPSQIIVRSEGVPSHSCKHTHASIRSAKAAPAWDAGLVRRLR